MVDFQLPPLTGANGRERFGDEGGYDLKFIHDTVGGRNPANQLRLVVHPIICKVFYIAGFRPSTVGSDLELPTQVSISTS